MVWRLGFGLGHYNSWTGSPAGFPRQFYVVGNREVGKLRDGSYVYSVRIIYRIDYEIYCFEIHEKRVRRDVV